MLRTSCSHIGALLPVIALVAASPPTALSQCVDTWSSMGGLNGSVEALFTFNGELIAGGAFTEAGGVPASRVARWDGMQWAPMGAGFDDEVRAFAVYNGDLIAGGHFGLMGTGITAKGIAKWNGHDWEPLGHGVNGAVATLAVYDDELIVGGNFTTMGASPETTVNHIARWNGAWQTMGTGIVGFGGAAHVNAIRPLAGFLYAAGFFTSAGGMPANYVAKWDGRTGAWSAVGPDSVNYSATILCRYGNRLVLGADFTAPGAYIASWDGASWSTFAGGMNTSTFAGAVYRNDLIVGGLFTVAGGSPVGHIARWDGAAWQPLGAGTNDTIRALVVYNDELIVGGLFTEAGGVAAGRIARWGASPTLVAEPMDWTERCPGDDVQFSAAAADGWAAYEWYKDGQILTDDLRVSGSRTNTLRIEGIRRSDEGRYSVVASTSCGATTSRSAVLHCQPIVPGDVNDDGDVNLTDLSSLLAHFGMMCN